MSIKLSIQLVGCIDKEKSLTWIFWVGCSRTDEFHIIGLIVANGWQMGIVCEASSWCFLVCYSFGNLLIRSRNIKCGSRSQGKVKVVKMLETFVEDTVKKHNLSVKTETVANHHLTNTLNHPENWNSDQCTTNHQSN